MLPSNKQSVCVCMCKVYVGCRQKPVQACSDIAKMSKANNRKDQPFCNDIEQPCWIDGIKCEMICYDRSKWILLHSSGPV